MRTLVISCGTSSPSIAAYVEAVRRSGWSGAIELASPGHMKGAGLGDACGLLLTGGDDIHPRNWGTSEPIHRHTRPDEERDALELPLARWAWNRGLPILGICRGAQVLNVARGGDLVQDIADATGCARDLHAHGNAGEIDLRHEVRVRTGSRLRGLVGLASVFVNSRHHQAVRRVGSGLAACAFHVPNSGGSDGLVEAIEAVGTRRWVVGVQWHPENLVAHEGAAGFAARSLFRGFTTELQRSPARSQDGRHPRREREAHRRAVVGDR